jgi:hypothetical protein
MKRARNFTPCAGEAPGCAVYRVPVFSGAFFWPLVASAASAATLKPYYACFTAAAESKAQENATNVQTKQKNDGIWMQNRPKTRHIVHKTSYRIKRKSTRNSDLLGAPV